MTTQQSAQLAPSTAQPKSESEPLQLSVNTKRDPLLKRQGPRPKITLGPEPQKPS